MMTRPGIVVLLVTAVVAIAGYWMLHNRRSGSIATQLSTVATGMKSVDRQAASAQRALHYENLDSIAQARELPSVFARHEAIYAIAGRADASALSDLIREAGRIPPDRERLQALEILILRQVEIEPDTALRTVLSMSRENVARLVPAVFGAWSQSDPEAAISALRQLPAASLRAGAATAILAANGNRKPEELRQLANRLHVSASIDDVLLAESAGALLDDPQQAITSALSLPTAAARHTEVIKIATAWARTAPEEAWEHAMQLDNPSARIAFQNAIVITWAKEHPEAAFSSVLELPPGLQRNDLLRVVAGELAQRDPHRAVELLANVESEEAQALRPILAGEWARKDVAGAAQWIESLPAGTQAPSAFAIANEYMAQQPEEALAWALRISRTPSRNLWSRMLGIMAEQNPDEALRIALAAESPAQRMQSTSEILNVVARRDPDRAMAYLEKLPAGQSREYALLEIGNQVGQRSADAALAWLDTVKNPQARARVATGLIATLVMHDVDGAAAVIDRVPKELRTDWILNTAGAYARASADPDKALQFLAKIRDDPLYPTAVGQVARSVAMRNPESALSLVERLDGRDRDDALSRLISAVAPGSPEVAVRWLDKISDVKYRDMAAVGIANVWRDYDAPAARNWVLSLQPTPGRDTMLANILRSSYVGSVDDTISLIDQIQSPARRMDAVQSMAMLIRETDPEGARTLLRRRPLDPAHQRAYENRPVVVRGR